MRDERLSSVAWVALLGAALGMIVIGKFVASQKTEKAGHQRPSSDVVDATLEDSFPASDAPSFTPVTGVCRL